jgi:uncharacterized protein (DUF486 family)
MTTRTAETSPLYRARVAGFLYLTLLPLGMFGLYVSSILIVPGDAATTAYRIMASESLFRLSIVSALLVQIANVFVVLALYRLLKPVNREMALLMVILLLLGVPIAMLNELNHFAVLLLLSGANYLTPFTASQLQALVPLFLALHKLGVSIAGIFWGLWLFPMGYLVLKSGFLPRILGILLIIGCFGYLIDSFAAFLLPNSEVNVAILTFWGEVLLPLWLVIKGVNLEQWNKRALEPA